MAANHNNAGLIVTALNLLDFLTLRYLHTFNCVCMVDYIGIEPIPKIRRLSSFARPGDNPLSFAKARLSKN